MGSHQGFVRTPPWNIIGLPVNYSKSSNYSVKWAIETFGSTRSTRFMLFHVLQRDREQGSTISYKSYWEYQALELLLSYKDMCQDKVETEVFLVSGEDVAATISDCVSYFGIQKLVVGVSSHREGSSTTFSRICNCAPGFCTVYSVSKNGLLRVHSPGLEVKTSSEIPTENVSLNSDLHSEHISSVSDITPSGIFRCNVCLGNLDGNLPYHQRHRHHDYSTTRSFVSISGHQVPESRGSEFEELELYDKTSDKTPTVIIPRQKLVLPDCVSARICVEQGITNLYTKDLENKAFEIPHCHKDSCEDKVEDEVLLVSGEDVPTKRSDHLCGIQKVAVGVSSHDEGPSMTFSQICNCAPGFCTVYSVSKDGLLRVHSPGLEVKTSSEIPTENVSLNSDLHSEHISSVSDITPSGIFGRNVCLESLDGNLPYHQRHRHNDYSATRSFASSARHQVPESRDSEFEELELYDKTFDKATTVIIPRKGIILPDVGTVRNTAKICLDGTGQDTLASYLGGIASLRAWCYDEGLQEEVFNHIVYTTRPAGTFHMDVELKNRTLTFIIQGRNLYVRGWKGKDGQCFELDGLDQKMNYITDKNCLKIRLSVSYADLAPKGIGKVRTGCHVLKMAFENIWNYSGGNCGHIAEDIGIMAIYLSEATRFQRILKHTSMSFIDEHYFSSLDCDEENRPSNSQFVKKHRKLSKVGMETVHEIIKGKLPLALPESLEEFRPYITSVDILSELPVLHRDAYSSVGCFFHLDEFESPVFEEPIEAEYSEWRRKKGRRNIEGVAIQRPNVLLGRSSYLRFLEDWHPYGTTNGQISMRFVKSYNEGEDDAEERGKAMKKHTSSLDKVPPFLSARKMHSAIGFPSPRVIKKIVYPTVGPSLRDTNHIFASGLVVPSGSSKGCGSACHRIGWLPRKDTHLSGLGKLCPNIYPKILRNLWQLKKLDEFLESGNLDEGVD